MNERILHKDVQDFIQQNLKSDLTKLILKGSPFEDITIQELANQITVKKKSEKKLPSWFQTVDIYYPPKLNLEQTSSEATAKYKANLLKGKNLIDLTGGFGVDCVAFSKRFEQVTHCELNTELSEIAAHNFTQLQATNIRTIQGDGIDHLTKSSEEFDCIYVDPSRRSDVKGKVFLLEDCEPNIPLHLNSLLEKVDTILVKVSPILDISSALEELNHVKEVHIVALNNEVKELLFLIERYYDGSVQIKTINLSKTEDQIFDFTLGLETQSTYDQPKTYLYEPNAAIMKSGGFHQIASAFPVSKLHQHSHLYTSEELIDFPGRSFVIKEVLAYDKKKIKKLLSSSKANVTTRNFPKSVEQIRKELKIKDGGMDYLFFTTNINDKLICIHCVK